MVTGFLTILHVIVSLVLIVVVLMQSQQSMNISGMFGGASQSALGNQPQSVLSRATTVLAIVFMLISLGLAMWPSEQTGTGALEGSGQQQATPTQPAEQGASPAAPGDGSPAPSPDNNQAEPTGDGSPSS